MMHVYIVVSLSEWERLITILYHCHHASIYITTIQESGQSTVLSKESDKSHSAVTPRCLTQTEKWSIHHFSLYWRYWCLTDMEYEQPSTATTSTFWEYIILTGRYYHEAICSQGCCTWYFSVVWVHFHGCHCSSKCQVNANQCNILLLAQCHYHKHTTLLKGILRKPFQNALKDRLPMQGMIPSLKLLPTWNQVICHCWASML